MNGEALFNSGIREMSQEEMFEVRGGLGWIGPVTNFLTGRLVWSTARVTYERCKSSMIIVPDPKPSVA